MGAEWVQIANLHQRYGTSGMALAVWHQRQGTSFVDEVDKKFENWK